MDIGYPAEQDTCMLEYDIFSTWCRINPRNPYVHSRRRLKCKIKEEFNAVGYGVEAANPSFDFC